MRTQENKCKRCGERLAKPPSYYFSPVLGGDKIYGYCSEECRQAAMATYRAKAGRNA